jgi:hypothetical protein
MKQTLRHSLVLIVILSINLAIQAQEIPLPEHPRPDFQREQWQNLNGQWSFEFDANNKGVEMAWFEGKSSFSKTILVPFPWGSNLSGVDDEADIAWYMREITVDPNWKEKRVFVTIGASDWETSVWLDGDLLGTHQGGYVPFSFELTDHVKMGQSQQLIIRVDDARRDFTLYGKQGYGNARGIWQTIYLEARGREYIDALHFSPDIDKHEAKVTAWLSEEVVKAQELSLTIQTPEGPVNHSEPVSVGQEKLVFTVPIPNPHLWSLDDPYLYEVEATMGDDVIETYFGMRKISVVNLPGTDFPYIALNNEPIYLQLALDQSYHEDGFYTFPSDQFIQEEIMRSKSIGLNGIRTHIKVEVPRKLYWADKLGLLVMEDLPNSWGEPDIKMQSESEYTLREMIRRDYNHPSIFSWIVFNETWGLHTNVGKDEGGNTSREYLPETQAWVASMYYLAKSLDQTRLVEDNSICCGRGHTETDINSWHAYLPGWSWDSYLKNVSEQTYEGSGFDFEEGYMQGKQPNINSECGNVWGYEGSTGDVDWSWDYHRMINTFRIYPKVAGWLYTEHHDVINEWNGYWRFDRSEKKTGMDEIVEGMDLNDIHSTVYLSTGNEICKTVQGGEQIEVPLYLSSMTGADLGDELIISYELLTTNRIAKTSTDLSGEISVTYKAWMQKELSSLALTIPDKAGLGVLKLILSDQSGTVLHRNFMHFEILSDKEIQGSTILTVAAGDFSKTEWSQKQWDVFEGKKVNGAGNGYFEYSIPIPTEIKELKYKKAYFLVEASAKELFVKDQTEYDDDQNFMRGSKVAPSSNPNSYPMTDEVLYPSEISVMIGGNKVFTSILADDPADHRGVLSWHHQLQDKKLREAGSYGYLLKVPIKNKLMKEAIEAGSLTIRLQTNGEGGIAIYGKEFGRYPLDPTLVLE